MKKFLNFVGILAGPAMIAIIALSACTPEAPPVPTQDSQIIAEPATPTPEIFNPLDPSPTPSESKLPMTCQVTDLNVYIDSTGRYCFAYPKRFTFGTQPFFNIPAVMGPAIGSSEEPLLATFAVEAAPYDSHKGLDQQVDEFLRGFTVAAPESMTRARIVVGGEAAVLVDIVPVQLSWRIVFVPHDGQLYRLMYWPIDVPEATADIDELYQTTLNSFAFLSEGMGPAFSLQTVSWSEFGQNISLSYDPVLAPGVETETIPAVPVSDQILFAGSHPAYAQIRFPGFQGGRAYDLPLLSSDKRVAQVMVFRTADFPGFGDDSPQGFVRQLQALTDLLQTGVEPDRCAQPFSGYESALPFLPWTNMQQAFCAQPQIIEFDGGKGIRYLTYYAQGPGPMLDDQVFYTFQGLTNDGQFYISAFFPVQTGIFPVEPPPCPKCGEPDYDPIAEWRLVLMAQLTQLNSRPEDRFGPSLILLDEVVQSIQISD